MNVKCSAAWTWTAGRRSIQLVLAAGLSWGTGGDRPLAAQPAAGVDELHLAADPHPVYRLSGDTAFFYRGEFQIDADGAPNAYHPGFTCDPTYKKQWKSPTKVDCATRTYESCERYPRSGFREDPAAGTSGAYVTCAAQTLAGKPVCVEKNVTTKTQGGCSVNAHESQGIDSLKNAGDPGHWDGIETSASGTPIIQGPSDPAPGFYVSTTALRVCSGKPSCYLDATRIHYIAIPKGALSAPFNARVGDSVVAVNWKTGKATGAVIGDIGGKSDSRLGEGSIALAAALGITGTPRGTGANGTPDVVYVVFAGSSQGFPTDNDDLVKTALDQFTAWGGALKVKRAAPRWAAACGTR